jgi:hypothetical protein
MRRFGTPLIVLAVGIVGVLAAADALRGRSEPEASVPAATTERAGPPTVRETLRQLAVSGLVLYSDESCRLHSLLLPRLVDDLVREEGGGVVSRCRFGTVGGRIIDEAAVPSPGGGQLARCTRGQVAVFETESGRPVRSVRGCAPAWHPDGRLTYAHDEQILEDGRVLYSKAELHRIARHHPNVAGLGEGVPFHVRVLALAWLDRKRLAVSLRVDIESVEPQDFVVLLDGSRIIALDASFAGPVRKLIASPAGTLVAEDSGTVLSRQGQSYPRLEQVPRPAAVVFSPDEGWLAMANGVSVYLVGTPQNLGRVIRLPIAAQDLVWEPVSRGTAVGPPIRR